MAPLMLTRLHIPLIALIASHIYLVSAQEATQFIYNGFKDSNLTINGMASIHPNGLLELTNTSKQQIGHAFFPFPIDFNSSDSVFSFSTTFVFAMVPEAPTLGGHGIAFVISPTPDFEGAIATQYLGLFNSTTIGLPSNHVIAVELDTVQNPEFGDINSNHVGIDINNLTSIRSATAAYFTGDEEQRELELISGDPIQVWIDYQATNKQLNVTLAPARTSKPEKPLLSANNLPLSLMDQMYIGFSSSTGSVASHHYILGWSFNSTGQARDLDISNLPSLPPQNNNSRKTSPYLKILLPLVIAVLLITSIALTIYFTRKRYEELHEDWEEQYGPQRFSYRDLHRATRGFNQILGSGGFGKVYKGTLLLPSSSSTSTFASASSNAEIAVKKISHDSHQGMREFVAEIATMGRLRHRNLVQLLGYCRREGELFLVYDHMPNGSLDKLLFGNNESETLNWNQRYKIMKGVAAALLYLHEEWEQVVTHRDVKASNVLLDADFNGRLGDFGLARFYDHGSDPQTTNIVGTIGYLAPELTRTGRATTSSDVFSFGVFMLEVACGRRPVEAREKPEEVVLMDWVSECWSRGEILEACDRRLRGGIVAEEVEMVLKLGLICANRSPTARPTMRKVVQFLEKNAALPEVSPVGDDISRHRNGSGDWILRFPDEITGSCSLSDADSMLFTGR
ncbi:L-type lectin-domain containing receptor kinase IV.2 [Linum perenne]